MSRQQLINNYFKSKSSSTSSPNCTGTTVKSMSETLVKKRNLSLIKPTTPTKIPKTSERSKDVSAVINLCSDEEDIWENSPKSRSPCIGPTQHLNDSETASDCSQNTVVYSPQTPRKILTPGNAEKRQTPPENGQSSQDSISSTATNASTSSTATNLLNTLVKLENGDDVRPVAVLKTPLKIPEGHETPRKTPQSFSSVSCQPSTSRSPPSRNKFFSPMRKKSIIDRTPGKVKRSLDTELSSTVPSRLLFEDDLYVYACEGMDDKTKFLLDIINKYLNDSTLKHLLDQNSRDLLFNTLQVVKPGMTLVCRLFWRKQGWYKEEQCAQICSKKYETLEPENLQAMLKSLLENKLLVQGDQDNMTFQDLVAILNREELKQICKELKLKIACKQTAIEALMNFSQRTSNISSYFTPTSGHVSSNSARVLKMMKEKTGPCYKLSDLARTTFHRLYIIMYLGMNYSVIREKKLELVLLYDKIKKETYPISKDMELDNASVVFRTKEEFDRYLEAHDVYEDFMTRTEVSQKCAIVREVYDLYKGLQNGQEMKRYDWLPEWLHRYTPESIYVKLLETGIQELKKEKHHLLALDILTALIRQDLFRQHKKADWYAEKALILHTLRRWDEAAEVLLEGFKSNLSEEAKDSMRPRAKKIASQKNITLREDLKMELLEHATKETILENSLPREHIYKQPMERIGKRGKVKFEAHSADERLVAECEHYCIYHYLDSGEFTHGEHWEGRIVTSIFFLLFWDIIFSKPAGARGVFLSHYQLYPLDLFTDSFYANRKQAIDDWLKVIEEAKESKLLRIVQDAWDSRPETELSGFQRSIGLENIKAVVQCLGARATAALCRRLAAAYRRAHSGFPDLTLWNAHNYRIKFVEVKTDTDKPSMKQIQWMQYLSQHSIETEFCYIGVNTTRQRSRLNTSPLTQKNRTPSKKKTPNKENKMAAKKRVKKESPVKTELSQEY